jgi:hypothetical protein
MLGEVAEGARPGRDTQEAQARDRERAVLVALRGQRHKKLRPRCDVTRGATCVWPGATATHKPCVPGYAKDTTEDE